MENKIQQLTEQLYNEGVAKGKQESEQLILQAKNEAATIIEKANKEADEIISKAKAEADSQKELGVSYVRRSGQQIVSQVKTQLQDLVVAKSVSADIKKAFEDESFIKELMVEAVKSWSQKSDSPIVLGVMEAKQKEYEEYLKSKIDKAMSDNLVFEISTRLKGGFTVSPKGEGYYISFTNEDFDALMTESLNDKIAEIVFGTTK